MVVNAESSPGSLLHCTCRVLLQRLGVLGREAKPRNYSFNKRQGLWARTEFRNTGEKPGRIPSVIEMGERCTCSNTGGTRREEREHYNLELELNNYDHYEESKIFQIKGEYLFLVL